MIAGVRTEELFVNVLAKVTAPPRDVLYAYVGPRTDQRAVRLAELISGLL